MAWRLFKKKETNRIIDDRSTTGISAAQSVPEGTGITTDAKKTLNEKNDYREYGTHYSEHNFNDKVRTTASSLGESVLEKIYLLFYLLTDKESPAKSHPGLIALITGVLGYFILPIDLIPDYLPGAGFADDIAAVTTVVSSVIASLQKDDSNGNIEEIRSKARDKAKSKLAK